MIVGGYTLDLYCDCPTHVDTYKEFPDQYYGERGSKCRSQARRMGWKLSWKTGIGIAICPKCSGKKPRSQVKASA
jgi:hypothetical protein